MIAQITRRPSERGSPGGGAFDPRSEVRGRVRIRRGLPVSRARIFCGRNSNAAIPLHSWGTVAQRQLEGPLLFFSKLGSLLLPHLGLTVDIINVSFGLQRSKTRAVELCDIVKDLKGTLILNFM